MRRPIARRLGEASVLVGFVLAVAAMTGAQAASTTGGASITIEGQATPLSIKKLEHLSFGCLENAPRRRKGKDKDWDDDDRDKDRGHDKDRGKHKNDDDDWDRDRDRDRDNDCRGDKDKDWGNRNATDGTVTVRARPPVKRSATGSVELLRGGEASPLVVRIKGEPNRLYRVSLPASVLSSPGGLTVNSFTLWTANRGDITATGTGQLDPRGVDTLRVGATMAVPKGTPRDEYGARVPITVSYE